MKPTQEKKALEFSGVSKTFSGPQARVQAVRDVSFVINAGEFVAIKGPSGSGKTTLLLIAGGLLRPAAGSVTVCGQSPYSLTPEERSGFRAERIGFVFQEFHLMPYLSVLDNILVPSLAKNREDAMERATGLAEKFGITARLHHRPSALSTGERQRTALARALFNQPALILADEPTGNLDDLNGKIVLDSLRAYAKEGGAVLLVTHDPRSAGFAHRTLIMKDGLLG
ncbi:MAG: ABC transporter ATP-binding protein [Verrucomicrobia bacterium]|nr:ABC transporter ATP-binding protein [Verrucomicrobiota bacterium]